MLMAFLQVVRWGRATPVVTPRRYPLHIADRLTPFGYNRPVNTARRTLGRWLLLTFLERGCDPSKARVPTAVPRIRPLSARELAELYTFPLPVVAVSNVRFLHLPAR
jgi:hypothetical protein